MENEVKKSLNFIEEIVEKDEAISIEEDCEGFGEEN